MGKSQTNSDVHSIHIRHKYDLHMPNADPTTHEKMIHYAGMYLLGTLPPKIKF